MKKIIFCLLAFVAASNAQSRLECGAVGTPNTSCSVVLDKLRFGQVFQLNGNSMSFFQSSDFNIAVADLPSAASVTEYPDRKKLPVRFYIYANDKDYNSAMSLLHTAYATKASVNVVFVNPMVTLFKNEAAYKASATDKDACYVIYDDNTQLPSVNNKPNHILCRPLALTLGEN